MSIQLRRQVDKIRRMILSLGGTVEQALQQAIAALEDREPEVARKVIDGDRRVDTARLDLEEEILACLALHQPVAFDLRYIISILKMANDLERIGDLAVNIAEQAVFLSGEEEVRQLPFDLHRMAVSAQEMLKRALDALVHMDLEAAEKLQEADFNVDADYREMFGRVSCHIREHPEHLDQMIHMINVARQIERVADHAVNIAEDVIYLGGSEQYKAVKDRYARRTI